MSYEAKMAEVQRIVESHNSKIPEGTPKVDFSQVTSKISSMGGTSEENLRSMTWEDIQDCGIPRILARRIANEVFRVISKETSSNVLSDIPLTEMQIASFGPAKLLELFDPTGDTNPTVTKRLMELSSGKAFLVYDDHDKVLIEESLNLLREIRAGEQPRRQVSLGGKLVRPRSANWTPVGLADENPLFPGTTLRADQSCPVTDRSYQNLSHLVRQILFLAVKNGDLVVANAGVAHDVLDRLDGKESPEKIVSNRYPKQVIILDDLTKMGKAPSLKIMRGQGTENRKENPFGTHKTT